MKTKITLQHLHDSDGFSRDDGWEAVAQTPEGTFAVNRDTEAEALEALSEALGMDVEFKRLPDSFTAY